MKFEKNLVTILKNFNTLNPSIVFNKETPLYTLSLSEATFAEAILHDEDTIEHTFAIYDLSQFLNTLSLFKTPEVKFKEKWLEIFDETQRVKYGYAPSETILTFSPEEASENVVDEEAVVASFSLTKSQIEQLLKSASILKLNDFGISSKGVRVFNSSSSSIESNQFLLNVGVNTTTDEEFVIKIENMKIVPADYEVRVAFQNDMGAVEFKTDTLDIVKSLRYMILMNDDSN